MTEVAVQPSASLHEQSLNEKTPVEQVTARTDHLSVQDGSKRLSYPSSVDSFKSTSSQPHANDTPASSAESGQAEEEWQPPAEGPLKTPIPRPSRASKPLPAPKLTPEQEKQYATVLATVSEWENIPATTAKNAAQVPLSEDERMWLTHECLLRYLRATKWNTAQALKRLQTTLSWRREYGADTFTADHISPENETGKLLILGYDEDCRPCLYMLPARQNTKSLDRQIQHLSYMVDRTIDMMPPGTENLSLLISFKNAAAGKIPSASQARDVLNILQNHNPERLGRALVVDVPWYVTTFFKLVSPFIDPVTKEKLKFNNPFRNFVPAHQLWSLTGGDLNFEYDHPVYWPALTEECNRRREAYRTRWVKAGKRIGESEEYLRGGSPTPLQTSE